jgi:hypothetical protein
MLERKDSPVRGEEKGGGIIEIEATWGIRVS